MAAGTERQGKVTMTAFALQGIFFITGYCFFDGNTVLPLFIETFTGRPELAGTAGALRQFADYLVQLLLGAYVVKVKNVPRYLAVCLLIGYSAPLFCAMALSLGLRGMAIFWTLLAGVALMWICDGLMVIGYYDLFGRTVSAENRGRVLGYQQMIGGAGAMAAAFLIKRILDRTDLDTVSKYIWIFGMGGLLLIPGALVMLGVRDTKTREAAVRETKTREAAVRETGAAYSPGAELKKIPRCLKQDRALRKVLLCQICFTCAMMVSPYILLLCRNGLGMAEEEVSSMLRVQVLGTLAGGAASAFLAPRFGNRFSVVFYCGMALLCGLSGLLGVGGMGSAHGAALLMVITSGVAAASWAGFMNVLIDLSGGTDTHVYLLANGIATLPLSAAGVAAGQIVKHAGYRALLAVSLLFASAAFAAAVSLLREEKRSC